MTTDQSAAANGKFEHRIAPVVLAGGSGTRLWPLSREDYPKQLLRLTGTNTLLQETLARLGGLAERVGSDDALELPVLVCNDEHRFLVAEQLEGSGHGAGAGRILLEPAGRNTAPALTLAALRLLDEGKDPVMLVMPADHVIRDRDAFQDAVLAGLGLASRRRIVTFGITPTRPEIGYGYIHTGAPLAEYDATMPVSALAGFEEKPAPEVAERYVKSGEYLWNAGLFMMRAGIWLEAMGWCRPDILDGCRAAVAAGRTDGAFFRVGADEFREVPSDSIDYAVMERVAAEHSDIAGDARADAIGSAVVTLNAQWSDVGSWQALLELDGCGDARNVIEGDVFTHDTHDCLLLSSGRLVAAVGLEDTIVVETPDAVLVANKQRTQDVKCAVNWLNEQQRSEGKSHRRVYRPWGDYEQLDIGDRYQVKRLTVKPGAILSLQMHHHRAEHWVVVRGTALVTRGEEEFLLTENESTYIPIGTRHRLANPGTVSLEVVEVQSGSYLGEDDIVRFEDVYSRVD